MAYRTACSGRSWRAAARTLMILTPLLAMSVTSAALPRAARAARATTVVPTTARALIGQTITVSWANLVDAPAKRSWVDLHPVGAFSEVQLAYHYISTAQAAGSATFTSADLARLVPGHYTVRVRENGQTIAESPPFVVAKAGTSVTPVGTGRRVWVITAYQRAFGRDPGSAELAYWMGLPSSDGRVGSLETLIANNRSWLVTHPGEQKDTIVRVYQAIFQRNPPPGEVSSWERRITRTPMIYSEMVRAIVSNLVKSAYQHLAVDPNKSGAPVAATDAVIASYTARVTSGALTGRSDAPSSVWSSVALSSAIDNGRGAYGPAYTDYQGRRERCFGGIGPKCEGAPGTGVVWGRFFTTPDGVRMGYEHGYVSVGSIIHDNTCLRLAVGTGAVCHGFPDYAFEGAGNNKDTFPAGRAWNKAVYNQRDTRFFQAWFGPYPTNESALAHFSDDLRRVPNRPAKLAHVYVIADSRYTIPYVGGETKQSHTLYGPRGTKIDPTDAAFCRSGKLHLEHNGTGQQWGICT